MNIPFLLIAGMIGVFLLTLLNPFYAVPIFIFGHFVEPVQFFPELRDFNPSLLLGYTVLVAWLLHIVFTGNLINAKNPLVMIVIIFIVWTFISIATNTYKTWEAQNLFIRNVIPFFIFVYMIQSRKHAVIAIWTILIMGAAAAIYGLYCVEANIGVRDRGMVRITSFMSNPNEFGKTMALLIPICICMLLSSCPKLIKLLMTFIILLLMTGVAVSYSRSAMISMLFVLVFTPVMYCRGSKKISALIVTIMVLPMLYYFFPLDKVKWRAHNRLMTTFQAETVEEVDLGRVETARAGWMMMLDNPVFGVGIGGFGYEYYHIAQSSEDIELVQSRYGDRGLSAHNLYVEIGGQLGIVGLTLYFFLIIMAINNVMKAEKVFWINGDELLYSMSRSLKIFLIAFMIIGITGSGLSNKLFWIMIGMTIVLYRIANQHNFNDNITDRV